MARAAPKAARDITPADAMRYFVPAQAVGNAASYGEISAAAASGRLSHSLLISGPSGCGRKSLAYRLAAGFAAMGAFQADMAANRDQWTPQVEKSARLLEQAAHPDILVLVGEGAKGGISAKAARSLSAFQTTTPSLGRGKVAIVSDADAMNTEASNALLKVLEEPRPSLAVILVAGRPGGLLPTIRSRVAAFSLGALSVSECEAVLAAHDLSLSSNTLQLCGGDAGLAIQLAKADVSLTAIEDAARYVTSPDAGRLPPKLASALVALEKQLSGALVIHMLLQSIHNDCRTAIVSRGITAQRALALDDFETRMAQRAHLSLDSTAAWMDALPHLHAMLSLR